MEDDAYVQLEEVLIPRAAAWLDRNFEGWHNRIDIEHFTMEQYDMCIGGYLNVDWYYALRIPFQRESGLSDAEMNGIFSTSTDAWIAEILTRRGEMM